MDYRCAGLGMISTVVFDLDGLLTDAELVLRRLDLARYFEAVATTESVARVKPHPDLFLHVAERLGVEASECVALEDAEKGVLAAHAADMMSASCARALSSWWEAS